MGARTLVVARRAEDCFDCRYAHWGPGVDPLASSRPLGEDWSAERVLAELDAGYERLLVRDGGRTYCVCWLDPTLEAFDDVALARTDAPAALRDWWTGHKSRAVSEVADGDDPAAVRRASLAALAERAAAVYPPDDASFLRDGG